MDQKPAHNTKAKEIFSTGMPKSRHGKILTITSIVIMFVLSGLYLRFAWNRYQNEAAAEAIMLVQSLESVLYPEDIGKLSGNKEDLTKPEYSMIKRSLTRLAALKDPINFAYLLGEREGDIIFLLDSESPESLDYSPPGQVYPEANATIWETFASGKAVLDAPAPDRWGTWISALVPIKNPADGRVIAVLGLDYEASEWYLHLWKQMIPDLIIVLCILMIFFVLLYTWEQNAILKSLGKKLAYSEALYRSVFNQAPIGIAIVNDKNFELESEFEHLSINPMFEQITGRRSQELKNIQWMEITHPEDLKADLDNFKQFKSNKSSGYSMEKRFLKPDGSIVWTNMKISQLLGISEKHSMHHLCLLEDISYRKATEKSLKESERSKSVLLSNLPGLAYRCNYDRNWTMQYVSAGCFALTGYPPESLLYNKDVSYNDLITPDYRDTLWEEWKHVLAKRLPFKQEYEIITATGEKKWVIEMGEGIFDEHGQVIALEGIVFDISKRKKYENLLVYNNEHDRWTGLLNRYCLENLLAGNNKKDDVSKRALACINMSHAQVLTKVYGFQYMQTLLKKTAEILSQYCTDKNSLFHTFIDRFVFYLEDYEDKNELYEFCQTIEHVLEPLLKSERLNAGIGVIEIEPWNKLDADLLLKKLLIASEKAFDMSDKHVASCFYDADMEAKIIREEEIKRELVKIADDETNKGMFLLYQPIFDLKSNKISAFEALARLKSEALGLVSPFEFIPIAEKTKLIIPLGQRIIVESLRFLKTLEKNGFDAINISINVSAIQLLQEDFVDNLLKTIHEMQVSPDRIGLELTESIFSSDYEEINSILSRLRETGLHIAIDDFGTGYSSLARESELSIDCLKIDKYFIDKLLEIQPEQAVIRDIISMAHKMGHL
ncbi:MAG: EAL domain-containing protein [Acidaminococcaceae bacterium]